VKPVKEITEFDLAVLSQLNKKSVHPPRSGKELKILLNEKDTRRIRLSIIKLIEYHDDVIVGDAGCGYYIAETVDEGVAICNRLMKTLRSLGHHHNILRKAVQKKLSGQLTLVKV
jgi:hypothetical protein